MLLFNQIAAVLFALALIHTFAASQFAKLAHRHPKHKGLLHLLSETEVVFGFWALIMLLLMAALLGKENTLTYLESRNFTEPLFVFVIMVIAASKPILDLIRTLIFRLSRALSKKHSEFLFFFCCLSVIPLLGSLITEPAAMTVAALLLKKTIFDKPISTSFKYGILAALFVNVSIGGTLTAYAAPPILMVANTWEWSSLYVFKLFGSKALLAVFINTALLCFLHKKQLVLFSAQNQKKSSSAPIGVSLIHLLFLVGVVIFAHQPILFIGLLLFFLGFTQAYSNYQDKLMLRESLLVAFFLGGLVVLGGQQSWWLQPILSNMSDTALFFGSMGLTAFADNAAITYLGSLVQGVGDGFKYAIVSGAIVGGGLTVVANAPNPAGAAILRDFFDNKSIHAGLLLKAAAIPTSIAAACFYFL